MRKRKRREFPLVSPHSNSNFLNINSKYICKLKYQKSRIDVKHRTLFYNKNKFQSFWKHLSMLNISRQTELCHIHIHTKIPSVRQINNFIIIIYFFQSMIIHYKKICRDKKVLQKRSAHAPCSCL